MPTNTIRLPEKLNACIAAAKHADFDATAEERYARIVSSGKTIPLQEMCTYLEERLAGNKANNVRPANWHSIA